MVVSRLRAQAIKLQARNWGLSREKKRAESLEGSKKGETLKGGARRVRELKPPRDGMAWPRDFAGLKKNRSSKKGGVG